MGPVLQLKKYLTFILVLFLVGLFGGFVGNGRVLGDEKAHPYYPLQLKVIHVDSHLLAENNAVPKNCDLQNFDAYCNESKNPSVEYVMVMEDAHGDRYTISCTVDSRWSKCSGLPLGAKFDGRQEKGGITLIHEDAEGRDKKEFYHLLDTKLAPEPAADNAQSPAAGAQPAAAQHSYSPAGPTSNGVYAEPLSPALSSHYGQGNSGDTVRCTFSTTPAGADIVLDGKYVGSTPSEIVIPVGPHTVVYTLSGFASWKRDLTVLPASELHVSAVLQKEQR
jgi:hypothetical protein